MIFRTLLLLGFLATAFGGPIPSYMTGRFKLYDSDNYDEFMEALGIGWFNRQLALSLTPSHQISQDGDTVSLAISTLLWSNTVKFQLDEKYDEKNPLGGTILSIAKLIDGNKLRRTRFRSNGKDIAFHETRTFTEGGNKMKIALRIPSKKITAFRYFKKVDE